MPKFQRRGLQGKISLVAAGLFNGMRLTRPPQAEAHYGRVLAVEYCYRVESGNVRSSPVFYFAATTQAVWSKGKRGVCW